MLTRPQEKPCARKQVEVALREDLVEEASRLRIDISHACEKGLAAEIGKTKAEAWFEKNREAVDYWNNYVEEHGLPLARYRLF